MPEPLSSVAAGMKSKAAALARGKVSVSSSRWTLSKRVAVVSSPKSRP
jgi:hypothetical protein